MEDTTTCNARKAFEILCMQCVWLAVVLYYMQRIWKITDSDERKRWNHWERHTVISMNVHSRKYPVVYRLMNDSMLNNVLYTFVWVAAAIYFNNNWQKVSLFADLGLFVLWQNYDFRELLTCRNCGNESSSSTQNQMMNRIQRLTVPLELFIF